MVHPPSRFSFTASPQRRGFTLIELLVAMAVIAILAAVALPSYSAYVQRSRVPAALDALSALRVRMEQCFQDTGTYVGCGACASPGQTAQNFAISCAITGTGSTATWIGNATGSGPVANYTYRINQNGDRSTPSHPKGSNSGCWTMRGGTQCDT